MNKTLKALRISEGLTQTDMAKKLGICLTSYNQKESGKSTFGLTEAKTIADIFGLTVDEIFFKHNVIDSITKQ